ncbi:hypothetical protein ABZ519_12980 [Streptomyces collinus]|uniref:hypothetical protein n=1 Tax=Streptomyces collinus TaxID=42684 RepID=UPI0034063646
MHGNRALVVLATSTVVCAGATATWLASAAPGSGQPGDVTASPTNSATPYVHTRPQDDRTGPGAGVVTLRSCPQGGADKPVGQNPWGLNCMALEHLADDTTVSMECWVSTTPPPDGKSAKWFKVTVTSGAARGREGWVWSDLVRDQTPGTPQCASVGHEKDPPPSPEPPLTFDVTGHCTTADGELANHSSGFTPGGTYSISATRPDGSAYPLARDSGTVASDGSVAWKWPCAGDPSGTYTTRLVDEATGREAEAAFTVAQDTTAPSGTPSTGGGDDSGRSGGTDGSATSVPDPAPSRPVTVYNKVTNGPHQMREDDSPAYLSSATKNFCADKGCALPGTEVRTGDTLTAVCQVSGDRTTNGDDRDPGDDSNPELAETRRWYGIRGPDGGLGYISAVWIDAGQRDGLGLPTCS